MTHEPTPTPPTPVPSTPTPNPTPSNLGDTFLAFIKEILSFITAFSVVLVALAFLHTYYYYDVFHVQMTAAYIDLSEVIQHEFNFLSICFIILLLTPFFLYLDSLTNSKTIAGQKKRVWELPAWLRTIIIIVVAIIVAIIAAHFLKGVIENSKLTGVYDYTLYFNVISAFVVYQVLVVLLIFKTNAGNARPNPTIMKFVGVSLPCIFVIVGTIYWARKSAF
ncbi:MAG TPA: hypothetical protein VF690_09670, partial [Hymenobacter sp.]